jgi:hypothetical protein
MTKNKLVNCYQLIEEEPSNVIDKLKKYLDDNEYLETEKDYSNYDTITVFVYKTKGWFKKYKYMFTVYKYGWNVYTKSFTNLEDLVYFSNTFTEKYHINNYLRVESIEKYNKRREFEEIKLKQKLELEKQKSELEKQKLKFKRENMEELKSIL